MARRTLLAVLVVLAAVCSADDGRRRTRLALPNGVQTDYTYAANDRLMSLVTTKGAATLASIAYTHDAVGNRTGITLANGETLAYTYDNAYRLTRELRKDAAQQTLFDQTFVYDAVGNRTSTVKNGITTTYAHNNANQLTRKPTSHGWPGLTARTTSEDTNGSGSKFTFCGVKTGRVVEWRNAGSRDTGRILCVPVIQSSSHPSARMSTIPCSH